VTYSLRSKIIFLNQNPKTPKLSSTSMTSSSSVPETAMQETPAYEIRGRTMSLEEWELKIKTENPVDFTSLVHHGCDIRSFYEAQGLMDYFNILNGPTYKTLVRH
jgi:hypothetical protein